MSVEIMFFHWRVGIYTLLWGAGWFVLGEFYLAHEESINRYNEGSEVFMLGRSREELLIIFNFFCVSSKFPSGRDRWNFASASINLTYIMVPVWHCYSWCIWWPPLNPSVWSEDGWVVILCGLPVFGCTIFMCFLINNENNSHLQYLCQGWKNSVENDISIFWCRVWCEIVPSQSKYSVLYGCKNKILNILTTHRWYVIIYNMYLM